MWRVLCDFADLNDGCHVYRAGDNYPYHGEADSERVKVLSGQNNKFGRPLIEFVLKTTDPEKPKRSPRKKKIEE